jgi:serine/threonine-protein kinase HipA
MQELVEAARSAMLGALFTENKAAESLKQIISVGTSAGGARAKAVVAWNPVTQEMRSGQFEVAPGFEHWLLKFDGIEPNAKPGPGQGFGRTEYAFALMARAAGIGMAESRLLRENGRAHFMTRRFDRDGNVKHHLQSLCAMAHMDFRHLGTHSYAQAFMVIAELGLGQDATDECFRRMAFNVMARNCDDHTKNIAFMLREGRSWELAPAYDLTPAYNPKGAWTFQHQMSVNGKFTKIAREDLLMDAERFGVRNPKQILDRVRDTLEAFDQFAMQAEIPVTTVDEIRSQFLFL